MSQKFLSHKNIQKIKDIAEILDMSFEDAAEFVGVVKYELTQLAEFKREARDDYESARGKIMGDK